MVGHDPDRAALPCEAQDDISDLGNPIGDPLCEARPKRVALLVEAPDLLPERPLSKQ